MSESALQGEPLRALLWAHRLAAGVSGATGIGRYTYELVAALRALEDPALQLELGSCREADPPDPALTAQTRVRRMPAPRPVVHLAWTAGPWPKVERSGSRPDVVHALSPSFPVRSRAPLICTVHDLTPITNPEWYGQIEGLGFRRAVADARRRAALVLTVSEHVRQLLLDREGFDPDRVRVTPHGVTGTFASQLSGEATAALRQRLGIELPYLLHVGMLAPRKHLSVLVRALAMLRPSLDIELVLAGPDRGDEAALRALALDMGVADRVRFLGFVAEADLAALVQGATALAHPALDEGFGLTPLEAMAAGTPVVVSAAGALPEVVGDAGVVVDGGIDAWGEALRRVVDDPTHAAELSDRGRARAATFRWDDHAAKVRQAYADAR
jgi:glycosyltransferase involved in cell wall biosynthesis